MSEQSSPSPSTKQATPSTWTEFLQSEPPGALVEVTNAVTVSQSGQLVTFTLNKPPLQLFCPDSLCNSQMIFECNNTQGGNLLGFSHENKWEFYFLTYRCRHCQNNSRIISFTIVSSRNGASRAYKFGEFPPFGPPTPPRLIKLIGPDKDIFLLGRRCENQGLGIGAFTYYRRVVEAQWTRLIDSAIRVAEKSSSRKSVLQNLQAAREERQFKKSVDKLKRAIPESLLIRGQNPFVLLHGALSRGVHELSDAECLELATSVRVILVELSDQLAQALKDEAEISGAVSRLLNPKKPDTKKSGDEKR